MKSLIGNSVVEQQSEKASIVWVSAVPKVGIWEMWQAPTERAYYVLCRAQPFNPTNTLPARLSSYDSTLQVKISINIPDK